MAMTSSFILSGCKPTSYWLLPEIRIGRDNKRRHYDRRLLSIMVDSIGWITKAITISSNACTIIL